MTGLGEWAYTPVDVIGLTQRLIRCPSVTPMEGGALGVLEDVLGGLGFACERVIFSEPGTPDVENLYARIGTEGPHLAFAGHTDVVPAGDPADWTHPPFGAVNDEDWIYGRGAVDMKGAIACFVTAVSRILTEREGRPHGSISFIITGDEEGPAVNGTRKLMEWLKARDEIPDWCLVGEPTSTTTLADTVKVGRRGSLNATLTVHGQQGHSAYPKKADNPVHRLVAALDRITKEAMDEGTDYFEPSNVQVTSVDVGNTATNVIPARATAKINVRFNVLQDGQKVEDWLRERIAEAAPNYELDVRVSAEPFITRASKLTTELLKTVSRRMQYKPRFTTDGGTSDARFIKDYCLVAEFGLRSYMAHQVDERVVTDDLRVMTNLYADTIRQLLPVRE